MGHHRETDKTDKTRQTRQDRQDRQEQSPEARMEVWPSTGADRGTVTQARSLTVSSALLVRARRQSRRRTPTDQSRDVGNGTTPRAGHAPLRSAFSQSAVPLPTSTGPRVHGSTGPRAVVSPSACFACSELVRRPRRAGPGTSRRTAALDHHHHHQIGPERSGHPSDDFATGACSPLRPTY